MNDNANPPNHIKSQENLGRRVTDRKMMKSAARGNISQRIFRCKEELKISMDRLNFISDEKMAEIAINNIPNDKKFYGWAVVIAENAAKQGRKIKAAPIMSNKYHAEICLPNYESEDKDNRIKEHRMHLADCATWRESPIPV